MAGGLSSFDSILEGEDSAGADSGRLRGGTGGGTGTSSEARLKLTMEETEEDLEWNGLLGPCGESNTLPTSVELEAAEAGGGVRGVRGELGAEAGVPSDSLSGMRL